LVLLLPSLLRAQGISARDEAIRQEELALERARRMKALKEQAMYEPPPRDINPQPAPKVTQRVMATAPQPAAEPFYFQVVTPQGLVPLEQWQAQQEQVRLAAAAPAPVRAPDPRGSSRGTEPRTMKLAFLSLGSGGVPKDPEEGRAVALTEAPASPGAPRAAVGPAEERARSRPGDTPATPGVETVAVMEELPPEQPGGAPRRRLLGFLSAKGLEAALAEATVSDGSAKEEAPPAPESDSADGETPVAPSRLLDRWVQRKTPAKAEGSDDGEVGEEAELLAEAKPRRSFQSENAGEFMNGLGTWLASAKALSPLPKSPEGGQFSGGHADYFTIAEPKAPFHVIDDQAGETHLVELEAGTVGRNHGEGEDWAWMQLDSGLMGLMKKRYLRPAGEEEVSTFLAAESVGKGASSLASGEVKPLRYLEVDLPDLPSEAVDPGTPLGGGLFPAMTGTGPTPEPSVPKEGTADPEASPAMKPPAPEPVPAPAPGDTGTVPAAVPPLP
jgi:hypothetical protein